MKTVCNMLVGLFVCVLSPLTASASTDASPESPDVIAIPAGEFISGSDREEREYAYKLDEAAYGHSVTRTQRWYESEFARQQRSLPDYSIMKSLVTQCDYTLFLEDTDHPEPSISESDWDAQGLIHNYQSTLKFHWQNRTEERCDHPVVLVSHNDALVYAKWLSKKTGKSWQLPTEFEWEKAARGLDGNLFPWGNEYDATKLNSHDNGPFDTLPVTAHESGASPFGMLDSAGQVFEWTATAGNNKRFVVKGGSWDDKGCGVCRPAARHTRPEDIKHILVGFRLVTNE